MSAVAEGTGRRGFRPRTGGGPAATVRAARAGSRRGGAPRMRVAHARRGQAELRAERVDRAREERRAALLERRAALLERRAARRAATPPVQLFPITVGPVVFDVSALVDRAARTVRRLLSARADTPREH